MTINNDEALNLQRKSVALAEAQGEHKNPTIAFLLWWFTGVWGGHRFYLGHKGVGVAMLLTFGGLGVWSLIDAFNINKEIAKANAEINQKFFTKHGVVA